MSDRNVDNIHVSQDDDLALLIEQAAIDTPFIELLRQLAAMADLLQAEMRLALEQIRP